MRFRYRQKGVECKCKREKKGEYLSSQNGLLVYSHPFLIYYLSSFPTEQRHISSLVSPFNRSLVTTIFPCEPKANIKPHSCDIQPAWGFVALQVIQNWGSSPFYTQASTCSAYVCMCTLFLSQFTWRAWLIKLVSNWSRTIEHESEKGDPSSWRLMPKLGTRWMGSDEACVCT